MVKDCFRHYGNRQNEATNSVLRTEEASGEGVIFESDFEDEQDFGRGWWKGIPGRGKSRHKSIFGMKKHIIFRNKVLYDLRI